MKMTNKEYLDYVRRKSPPSPLWRDVGKAFVAGGLLCCIGQLVLHFWGLYLDTADAAASTSVTMILLGAVLTGLGVYDKIAGFGGAGTLVPITGFANAMVAPALEFKSDVRCIIRIVRENRDRRVSGLNPTKFIGKEVLEAAIIPHEFRLPRSQMGVADPSGSSFSEYYTHRRSYHATRSIVL